MKPKKILDKKEEKIQYKTDWIFEDILYRVKSDVDTLNKRVDAMAIVEIDRLFYWLYREILQKKEYISDIETSYPSDYFDKVLEYSELLSQEGLDYLDAIYDHFVYKLYLQGIDMNIEIDEETDKKTIFIKKRSELNQVTKEKDDKLEESYYKSKPNIKLMLKKIKEDTNKLQETVDFLIIEQIERMLYDNLYKEILRKAKDIKGGQEISFVSNYFNESIEYTKLLSEEMLDYLELHYRDFKRDLLEKHNIVCNIELNEKTGKKIIHIRKELKDIKEPPDYFYE